MAAKISVSLPEALKTALDGYAQEHGMSVSQVVQKALEALLSPAGPPPPPPPPPANLELVRHIANLERYVSELGAAHGQLRDCLGLMALWINPPPGTPGFPFPEELPPPPWQG